MIVYTEKFTGAEVEKVINEGVIYMCACPAQVAQTIRTVRTLYRYQRDCIDHKGNDDVVHNTIAEFAVKCHNLLEECMEKILVLENWDRETLEMPSLLRKKQYNELMKD